MTFCRIAAIALMGIAAVGVAPESTRSPVSVTSVHPRDHVSLARLERETTDALDQWRKVLT